MSYPPDWNKRAPRLATIAAWINANTTLYAWTQRSYCNTDRKLAGTRCVHPGKGRWGTLLEVRRRVSADPCNVVFNHNSAETYRRNSEVVSWLEDYLERRPDVLKRKDRSDE